MTVKELLTSKTAIAVFAALTGAGGGQLGPLGLDTLRAQDSLSVTFSGKARSALAVQDDNGQPLVTKQDYSRACLKAIDGEAQTRLKAFAEKPVAN